MQINNKFQWFPFGSKAQEGKFNFGGSISGFKEDTSL